MCASSLFNLRLHMNLPPGRLTYRGLQRQIPCSSDFLLWPVSRSPDRRWEEGWGIHSLALLPVKLPQIDCNPQLKITAFFKVALSLHIPVATSPLSPLCLGLKTVSALSSPAGSSHSATPLQIVPLLSPP